MTVGAGKPVNDRHSAIYGAAKERLLVGICKKHSLRRIVAECHTISSSDNPMRKRLVFSYR